VSRPGSPMLTRPIPQRSLSQELDLNGTKSLTVNGSKGKKSDLVSSLEAQAEEMY